MMNRADFEPLFQEVEARRKVGDQRATLVWLRRLREQQCLGWKLRIVCDLLHLRAAQGSLRAMMRRGPSASSSRNVPQPNRWHLNWGRVLLPQINLQAEEGGGWASMMRAPGGAEFVWDLMAAGLLEESGGFVCLTDKGRAWCTDQGPGEIRNSHVMMQSGE